MDLQLNDFTYETIGRLIFHSNDELEIIERVIISIINGRKEDESGIQEDSFET